MFSKLAYAQRVLRSLAAEKQAGAMTIPLIAGGAALAAGAHTVGKGLGKGKQYKAGFQPGVFESEAG